MSRETKLRGTEVRIGLSVLAMLFVGLAVVIVFKFRGSDELPAAHLHTGPNESDGHSQTESLASGPAQPTVLESPDVDSAAVVETASSELPVDWKSSQPKIESPKAEEDEPRRSFMPKSTSRYNTDAGPGATTEPNKTSHAVDGDTSGEPAPIDSATAAFQQQPQTSTTLRPTLDPNEQAPTSRSSTLPSQSNPGTESAPSRLSDSVLDDTSNSYAPPTQQPSRYNSVQVVPAEPTETTAPASNRYGTSARATRAAVQPATPDSLSTPRQFGNSTPRQFDPTQQTYSPNEQATNPIQQAAGATQSQSVTPVNASRPANINTGKTIVEPGDSLWTISQRVYGTGAFFKAIQEHNRQRFPNGHDLRIGDEILTPEPLVLRKKYPGLCPRERKRPPRSSNLATVSHRQLGGSRTYVVEEGDTLYDIARYELGAGGRWPEIFDLNRERLAHDFDYLRPGTKLVLPVSPSDHQQDALTRNPNQLRR